VCDVCPLRAQCTSSKEGRRINRHIDEDYLDRVRAYHRTEAYEKAMRKRKLWTEPLFAEAKLWHGLRRFRLRRLWRVNVEALMVAAAQNLKRLLRQRGRGLTPASRNGGSGPLHGRGYARHFCGGHLDRGVGALEARPQLGTAPDASPPTVLGSTLSTLSEQYR